ncbi:uncharacterized protein N7525_011247 [Penicillium rubens]|uniref:uncharacterized protein n=1 Tax=Penicillium rubens TaxID=1108849 RepID=UPI002A5A97A3|nr:uncharacterized protein N7525_011247 [Penicillium rubens]KAJ5821963.1 hypothetical protein N7525_011247 [Penicillium rubens]
MCHDTHYIYRSLEYLSVTLRYSVCNSPVQGQVLTRWDELKGEKLPDTSQFAPTEGSVCGVLQIAVYSAKWKKRKRFTNRLEMKKS